MTTLSVKARDSITFLWFVLTQFLAYIGCSRHVELKLVSAPAVSLLVCIMRRHYGLATSLKDNIPGMAARPSDVTTSGTSDPTTFPIS